jgi:superfamily II DNA or RNA helicase
MKSSGKRQRSASPSAGGLRSRSWKRFLKGPDPQLLEGLYVPALQEALHYDRCCAYFSSSVLSAAARGFAALIERLITLGDKAPKPAVRLVVNEELSAQDIRAITETGDLSALEKQLARRLKTMQDLLEKKRLEMLAWLVKKDLARVRVGIVRSGQGIVHAKFGIMTDTAGHAVVFNGSGNESAYGLAANYECLEVSTSWGDPERYAEYSREFEELWFDTHPYVHTVTLPEAIRLKLVRYAPEEPPLVEPSADIPRQKAAMVWRFICEAPYLENGAAACDATALVEPWPHQRQVVEETSAAWPTGRLLCDEVGMGKTIEAILALRRLMAGRGVQRVLFLLPAGLLAQWQAELREKGGLIVPRLEGLTSIVWPDGSVRKVGGLSEALLNPTLVMSRETARTEQNLAAVLDSPPWDLVILDEAHAARRRKQEEGEFNGATLLLNLLRKLQLRKKARGIFLLSATPMQTHPWEPWDLLAVLGEGGHWLAEFSPVRSFYTALAAVRTGRCGMETAAAAASIVASDDAFPAPPGAPAGWRSRDWIQRKMVFHTIAERESIVRWLRYGAPLMRRMHRNTRTTLREYHRQGFLKAPPPIRTVQDEFYDYQNDSERRLYREVGRYIERRFELLETDRPGKGFVMTVYRRRVSSSPYALQKSLERRREGLKRVSESQAYDQYFFPEDLDSRDLDDLGDFDAVGRISSGLPSNPEDARKELAEVDELLFQLRKLDGTDSKLLRFYDVLRTTIQDGRSVLVFTEYADTMVYLREKLSAVYGTRMGCYSGNGGEVWDGERWKTVSKALITDKLKNGELSVLICTDAASEGLNLQAAGAVINYDLPWNPSKVEQRIGRVDRIGQKLPQVIVVNLFLKDSVDENVYRVLRQRCGLFEHFVGPMQPVLSRARNMLLGNDRFDAGALTQLANTIEADPIQSEMYGESPCENVGVPQAPLSVDDLRNALAYLQDQAGFKVKNGLTVGTWVVSAPGFARLELADSTEALEKNERVLPLSPLEPRVGEIPARLTRSGEHLPLVVGSAQKGPFRASCAYWLGGSKGVLVKTLAELEELVERWEGGRPEAEVWLQFSKKARERAERMVGAMSREAERKEREGLEKQLEAVRIRLKNEFGRYLICLGNGSTDFGTLIAELMTRDSQGSQRVRTVLEKLGGVPVWDSERLKEIEELHNRMTPGQREARLLFKELDAALDDPRWEAGVATG